MDYAGFLAVSCPDFWWCEELQPFHARSGRVLTRMGDSGHSNGNIPYRTILKGMRVDPVNMP